MTKGLIAIACTLTFLALVECQIPNQGIKDNRNAIGAAGGNMHLENEQMEPDQGALVNHDIEVELRGLKQKNEEITVDLENKKQEISILEKKLLTENENNRKNDKKVQEAQEKLVALMNEKNNLEKAVSTANTENAQIREQLQKAISDYTTLEQQKKQLQTTYDEHVAAEKLTKDNLVKEIAKGLRLENRETDLLVEIKTLKMQIENFENKTALEHERYTRIMNLYNEAQEQLNHPAFVDYVAAQGRDIGEKRPELKAAFQKAKDAVAPQVNRVLENGAAVLDETKVRVATHMKPLLGDDNAKTMSLVILFFLMLIPIYVTFSFTQKIRRALQLHHVLMFQNFYAACFFGSIIISSMSLPPGQDALNSAQSSKPTFYSVVQLLIALAFIAQLVTAVKMIMISDVQMKRAMLGFHLISIIGLGWHYYVNIWQEAMLDRPHIVSRLTYVAYALTFAVGIFIAASSKSNRYSIVRCSSDKYT